MAFKMHRSLEAEHAADEHYAREAKARLLALADKVWRGEPVEAHERIVIVEALQRRASAIEPIYSKGGGPGNPSWERDAVYDRLLVAVGVELVIRHKRSTKTFAYGEVAAAFDESLDVVSECYKERSVEAKAYLDHIGKEKSRVLFKELKGRIKGT